MLRTQPRRHPPLRLAFGRGRRPRGGDPARRRTARSSPRCSRPSTISSWASSAICGSSAAGSPPTRRWSTSGAARRPRPGHIYVLQGKQQEEVPEAIAGDIVAIAKFDDLHVSDTVSNVGGNTTVPQLRVRPIKFPIPMVPRAVEPKARDDEAKISVGPGQDRRRGPDVLHPPRRPDARAGDLGDERPAPGHRPAAAQEPLQAGDEHPRPAGPLPRDDPGRGRGATTGTRSRPAAAASSAKSTCGSGPASAGEGFNFVDAVKGGTIPNQFIPAVEKGVREQMEKGVISGNQVVDVEVEVFFGKDHPVDSSEQAFKTAAATAFRKAFEQARPGPARADRHDRDHRSRPRSSATSPPTCPPAAATSPGWTRSPAASR